MADSLSDYFAQLGININTGDFGGSDGLARAVEAAQRGIVGNRQAEVAGMPMITPTGAATRSPFGSYWSVPTATGTVYLRPDTWTAPQNVNSSAFQDSLKAGGSAYTAKGNGGSYIADSPGSYNARFSGNLPGIDPAFMGNNPESSWSVWNQAPTERFVQDVPDETMLQAFLQGPAIPLGGFIGAGAFGAGGIGNFLGSFGGGAAGAAGGAMDMGIGLNDVFGLGDVPWGVNPQSGGSMDWWDDFINSVGDAYPGSGSNGIVSSGSNVGFNNPFDEWERYLGKSMTDNGAVIPSPTISIPGYGDVYGSWPSIIKSLPGITNMPGLLNNLVNGGQGFSGLGAGLGALLGALGANQKPAGTTTSVQDIPEYLKPYQAMNLASGTANFANAGAGASLLPGAAAQLGKTINGDYLNPNTNPAFQPYVKDLMGQAGANFASLYGKSPDNLNNSAFQENYTRAITNAALPLYNQAFQTERGNQLNAANAAPGFASNYAGASLAPNLAFKNLYTGAQSTTQPYFTSPLGGALSGALAGGALGNSVFGGK